MFKSKGVAGETNNVREWARTEMQIEPTFWASAANDNREYMELKLPSAPEYVAVARHLVADFAQTMNLPGEAVEDMKVAISEACTNVVRHAYHGQRGENNLITVRCVKDASCLTVEIADCGRGFDALAMENQCRQRSVCRDGGFGLILIRSCMDEVSYSRNESSGTVVKMVKYLMPQGTEH